jgi:hypothetical protein
MILCQRIHLYSLRSKFIFKKIDVEEQKITGVSCLHCSKTKQISESTGEEVPWMGNFPVIRGTNV